MSKEIKAPDWFNGKIYENGDVVTNPINGKSIDLNALELSIYDLAIGFQMLLQMNPKLVSEDQMKTLEKTLTWFKENNPEAYKVLLA